jgi:hypothetical protein
MLPVNGPLNLPFDGSQDERGLFSVLISSSEKNGLTLVESASFCIVFLAVVSLRCKVVKRSAFHYFSALMMSLLPASVAYLLPHDHLQNLCHGRDDRAGGFFD